MNLARIGVAGALVVALLPSRAFGAQSDTSAPGTKAPAAAQAEVRRDTLGRDTPRGTLLGFVRAARDGNDEAAVAYLNTGLRGDAAKELAHQLYVVLDIRLPARLGEVSDRSEGALSNPLKPDQDVIGTIQTAGGPLEIAVERVNRGSSGRIWLFTRRTLESIPDVFDEIDLVKVERYLPPPLTKFRLAGVRLFDWAVLFVAFPVCYRLIGLVGRLITPLVTALRRRYRHSAAAPLEPVPGFVRLLLLAIAIRWLIDGVDLPLIERRFWTASAAMLAIVAATRMLLVANAWVERRLHRRFAGAGHGEVAAPLRLARRVMDVLVIAAAAIVTLEFYGVDPTAALAGLGIGGIAVALAAQKTLENVIGGLSIIFDKAVRVGDFLKLNETFGTVDYIGLRSTRIRTLDRTILSVPNGQIANLGIETLSSRDKFWFHHFIGLRYETTARQLNTVIEDIQSRLVSHPSVDVESVRVRFLRFGSHSLDIELFAYIFAADWVPFLDVQQELLLHVMATVERAGTALAFPSQTLYFADSNRFAALTGDHRAASI
jgi:MscS family membrane protein